LVDTLKQLREAGSKGLECILYWIGKLSDEDNVVLTECLRPLQTSTYSGFRVEPLTLAEVFVKLHKQRSLLVAAIHSHPGAAFHSFTDDRHPAIYEKGLTSIVVPNFGFIEEVDFIKKSAFFRYEEFYQWKELDEDEISELFKFLPRNFEEERLSRIGRLIESLQLSKINALLALKSATVGVSISEELLKTYRGQLLLFSLVNMLARYSITVGVYLQADLNVKPEIPRVSNKKVSDGLEELYLKITARNNLRINPKRKKKYDFFIGIGDVEQLKASHTIFVEAKGWNLCLNRGNKSIFSGDSRNPIGPNLCASFASIEAVKFILNARLNAHIPLLGNFSFSSLDYSFNEKFEEVSIGEWLDLGKMAIVGIGAVNTAFVYGLVSMPSIEGEFAAVDPEKIEIPNLGTYPLTTIFDLGLPKIKVAKNALQQKIKVHTYESKYENWPERTSYTTMLLGVDNRETRLKVEAEKPELVLHGGLYGGGFTISRHNQTSPVKLSNLYHNPGPNFEAYPSSPSTAMMCGNMLLGEAVKEFVPSLRKYRLSYPLHVTNAFYPPVEGKTWLIIKAVK